MVRLVGLEPTCIQLSFQLLRRQRLYKRVLLYPAELQTVYFTGR
jgi:hypothetical protein